jgi:hypothetical protein
VAGTTGQLLVKNSGTDYDTGWTSTPTVDSITVTTGGSKTITTAGTELITSQTGDVFGRSILSLRNRQGANGAIFTTRNTTGGGMGLVDFRFDSGSLYQSNIRLEARGTGFQKVGPSPATVTEFQFIDDATATPTIYFCSNKTATVVRAGNFGVGVDNPQAAAHIAGELIATTIDGGSA